MRKQCPACGKAKVLFATQDQAQRYIKAKRNSANSTRLKPYYCPACQGWHLTHHTR